MSPQNQRHSDMEAIATIPVVSKPTPSPLPQDDKSAYLCPITMEIMRDPVITRDGYSFERNAILGWIATKGTCPITRNPIVVTDLIPNNALRNTIKSKFPEVFTVNDKPIKIKPQANRPIDNTEWIPVRSVVRSAFANVREVALFGSRRISPDIASIQPLSTTTIAPVENPMPVLPQTYLFPNNRIEAEKRMLTQAYCTITRINMWDYLHNFEVDENLGFMLSQDETILQITCAIEEYSQIHSGSSMAYTMRHMHHIAKHGIAHYEQFMI
jgi:hypothetical protein